MKQAPCPVTKVAKILCDTWTILIIQNVLSRPMRFCELERALPGISTRTLTLKLNRLRAKQLLSKTDSGYALTKRAKGVGAVIEAMEAYGKRV